MAGADPLFFIAAAPTLLRALAVTFFYALPAGLLHLMVSGLADPRREAWSPPPEAEAWKARYRRGAFFGQYVNLFLLGLFLVHLLNGFVLERAGCEANASHLTGAAFQIAQGIDRVFAAGIVLLALFALAGFVWSVLYFAAARRNGWPDPRRRDGLIVHVALVPLAVFLMFVSFSVLFRSLCPGLV